MLPGDLAVLEYQGSASPDKSIFETWNQDGSQYAGVLSPKDNGTDPNVLLFDGTTGKKVGSIAGTGTADHPATPLADHQGRRRRRVVDHRDHP